jgi:hypothetical protein
MSSRIHVQHKASGEESSAAVHGAQQDGRIAGSPALLAQRKQLESAFGPAAQLMAPEEELQAKTAPEEELQAKVMPDEELQAVAVPDEELTAQGKSGQVAI